MNWIEKVKSIKLKLADAGYSKEVESILNAQMYLGTPGEMYLEVINVLLAFKSSNISAYNLINIEIEELLAYGREIKYFNQ